MGEMPTPIPEPYRPRTIRFHGVRERDDWRIKLYSISHDGTELAWADFSSGITSAEAALPEPARTALRPGLAFMVAHQGRTADYVVSAWWDNENELPVRLFVRRPDERAGWRPARDGESFCVWDLEVMWHERDAYVSTLLTGRDGDRSEEYLSRHLGAAAEAPLL